MIFLQALAFFILGIYLASQSVPSNEAELSVFVAEEFLDTTEDISNDPTVTEINDNLRKGINTFKSIGWALIIVSVLELIGLFFSIFRN